MNEWGLSDSPPQYGAGQNYQAGCPAFPAAPAGYVAWSTAVNGAVPTNVQQRASQLANDMTKPLGYTETIYSGGVPLLLRVDPHTWSSDSSGNSIAGCFHGVDVWVPSATPTTPATPASESSFGGTAATLFALSLGLGAVVSAISIYEWLHRGTRSHA